MKPSGATEDPENAPIPPWPALQKELGYHLTLLDIQQSVRVRLAQSSELLGHGGHGETY